MFARVALFFIIAAFLCIQTIDAFRFPATSVRSVRSSLQAKKPEVATPVTDSKYWQGDWVCADCGYVYDRDIDGGGMYFEEQKRGFICPQCSAPRKRYAKKVGEVWGVTRDGGDLPIYAFSFLGIAVTTWFALVYVPTL
jgi:rubredoxin